MFVPAEKNTVCHGLYIHVRAFCFMAFIRFIFENFFMKLFILAPASHSKKRIKGIRERGRVKIP